MPKGNKTEQDKKILQGMKDKSKRKSYIQKTFEKSSNLERCEAGQRGKNGQMNKTSSTLLHCNKKRNLQN